jgi:hypothetical protein
LRLVGAIQAVPSTRHAGASATHKGGSGMITRCKNCLFWDRVNIWGQDKDKASCRINPPGQTVGSQIATWPSTMADDWCGQFQPRLDK